MGLLVRSMIFEKGTEVEVMHRNRNSGNVTTELAIVVERRDDLLQEPRYLVESKNFLIQYWVKSTSVTETIKSKNKRKINEFLGIK